LSEFSNQVGDLNAVLKDSRERLDNIKAALERAVHDDSELYTTAVDLEKRMEQLTERMRGNRRRVDLEKRMEQLTERMRGNRRRSRYNDAEPVSVAQRLGTVVSGGFRSTYGPTPMHLEQYEIAKAQFGGVREELSVILDDELPALENALDAAGVPWTSGRKMR